MRVRVRARVSVGVGGFRLTGRFRARVGTRVSVRVQFRVGLGDSILPVGLWLGLGLG